MSGYESPMLKSARQMSEAQAYGFNNSGTMAGQVGADAAKSARSAGNVRASSPRSSGRSSGGRGGSAYSAGGQSSGFFSTLLGIGFWLVVLVIFGPMLLSWASARTIEAVLSLESFVPDIVGYVSVVLFSLIAMFIFGSMTRLSIIIAGMFWLGSVAAMIFLLMRWHGPAAGVAWIPALFWSFPVYASLIGVLTLPLHYAQLSQDSLGDNLRSAFLIFLAPGGALCLALIGGSMALGYPGVIPLGLIIIIPGMAMIAGLFAYCALAAKFVRIAQKT